MSICARQEPFCFRRDKNDEKRKIRSLPYTIQRCPTWYTEDEEEEEEEERKKARKKEKDDDDDDVTYMGWGPRSAHTLFSYKIVVATIWEGGPARLLFCIVFRYCFLRFSAISGIFNDQGKTVSSQRPIRISIINQKFRRILKNLWVFRFLPLGTFGNKFLAERWEAAV